jgi:hypothetical protein
VGIGLIVVLLACAGGTTDLASAQIFNDNTSDPDCTTIGSDAVWDDADCWVDFNGNPVSDYPDDVGASVILDDGVGWLYGSDLSYNLFSLDLQAGTVNATSTNVDYTIGGSLDVSGTYNVGTGTTTVGGESDNDGTINIAENGVLDMNARLNNLTGGVVNLGVGTLELSGDFANSGSFSANSQTGAVGTVIFDGTGTRTISGTFADPNQFIDVQVNADATVDLADNLTAANSNRVTIDGQLTVVDGGRFGAPGELADVLYRGKAFSITNTDPAEQGFTADELTFASSTSSLTDPVIASGEVFSRVTILNTTSVEVQTSFEVNELLTNNGDLVLDGGSLTLRDDFVNNANYTPGTDLTVFDGQTNTGSGEGYDVSSSDGSCDDDSLPDVDVGGVETSDGDCEQDIRGSGNFVFGPVRVDRSDTRAVLALGGGNPSTPSVTNLTIDFVGVNDSNVEFFLNDSDLEVSGNITNNGTFDPGDKKVILTGGSTQVIDSPAGIEFFQLELDKSASAEARIEDDTAINVIDQLGIVNGRLRFIDGVSNSELTIEGELLMAGGVLEPADPMSEDGPVTLLSGDVEFIDDNGDLVTRPADGFVIYDDSDNDNTLDGLIDGTIRKQRTLTESSAWYFIGTPASSGSSNDTFSDFLKEGPETNNLWTQGFTGADAEPGNGSVANVRFYDESVAGPDENGFEPVSGLSSTMTSGQGYIIYPFRDDNRDGTVSSDEQFPKLIDSQFEPYNDISFDFTAQGPGLTATDAGGGGGIDSEDGWNLLSNPYLASFAFDNPGLTFTNVDEVVYVYDPNNENYVSWSIAAGDAAGSGEPGGGTDDRALDDGFIAPNQAFFVKANGSNPNLVIDDITVAQENVTDRFLGGKSTTSSPQRVRLAATDPSGTGQDMLFAFTETGTDQKDAGDAYHLSPIGESVGTVEIFSVLENGDGLTIDHRSSAFNADGSGRYTEEDIRRFPFVIQSGACEDKQIELTVPQVDNIPAGWAIAVRDHETGDVTLFDNSDDAYEFTLSPASTCPTAEASNKNDGATLPGFHVSNVTTDAKSGFATRFQLIIDPTGVIPVEMGSFNGSSDGPSAAILEWSTLSESNNSGFYVEQKVDGSFQTVSSLIEGAGTTTEQQSYRYRVEDLEQGTTHTFRLRQVDVDGAKTYSETVDVKIGIQEAYQLEAYPNPVANGQQPTVRFAVDESQPVTIELYNTLGQRVRTLYNDTPRVTGEFQDVNLDVNGLASGVYFIRMRGESFATTKKLVVVR